MTSYNRSGTWWEKSHLALVLRGAHLFFLKKKLFNLTESNLNFVGCSELRCHAKNVAVSVRQWGYLLPTLEDGWSTFRKIG